MMTLDRSGLPRTTGNADKGPSSLNRVFAARPSRCSKKHHETSSTTKGSTFLTIAAYRRYATFGCGTAGGQHASRSRLWVTPVINSSRFSNTVGRSEASLFPTGMYFFGRGRFGCLHPQSFYRRGISIVNRHVQHHQALGTDRTTAEMSNGHGREPRNPRLYGTPCYAPSTTQSPHTSPSSTTCSSSSSQPLPAEDQSYQPLPVEDHDCVCHASYEWGNRTSTTSNRRLRQTSPTTRNSAPCQIARPTKTLPYNRRPQCWPPLRRPSSSSSPREPLQKP